MLLSIVLTESHQILTIHLSPEGQGLRQEDLLQAGECPQGSSTEPRPGSEGRKVSPAIGPDARHHHREEAAGVLEIEEEEERIEKSLQNPKQEEEVSSKEFQRQCLCWGRSSRGLQRWTPGARGEGWRWKWWRRRRRVVRWSRRRRWWLPPEGEYSVTLFLLVLKRTKMVSLAWMCFVKYCNWLKLE